MSSYVLLRHFEDLRVGVNLDGLLRREIFEFDLQLDQINLRMQIVPGTPLADGPRSDMLRQLDQETLGRTAPLDPEPEQHCEPEVGRTSIVGTGDSIDEARAGAERDRIPTGRITEITRLRLTGSRAVSGAKALMATFGEGARVVLEKHVRIAVADTESTPHAHTVGSRILKYLSALVSTVAVFALLPLAYLSSVGISLITGGSV